jgi:hypothetical protein
MKHFYTLLLVISGLIAIQNAVAAEGDTIRVASHQETHWDWNGNWYDTTAFPTEGSFRRILMYYTLGCPSQGCSEWDYTTKIEVEDPINDSTSRWVELTRIITPYAGDKGADWKHTWVIDVTDFAPVLTGVRQVRAHYGGWQDGFTVTINFDFIEGTPPRNVLEVNTLYDGTFRYGFANDPIENYLVPTDIAIHPDMRTARFRMVASGHSFGGNENCAEFCRKWFRLHVDGTQHHQQSVWRDDCGSNPLEGQTGTWIYNRAGWCPGDVTTPYEEEIGGVLFPGSTQTFDVEWQGYNYQGGAGFDPQYIIESTIFQYDDWNFNLDLELLKVISPSLDDRAVELNPICNNPKVLVRNSGASIITKANFKFWVEGSPDVFNYSWNQPLLPGDTATVSLPSFDRWLFGGKTKNLFHVEITEVNGTQDGYSENNKLVSAFEDTPVLPSEIVVVYDNNFTSNETKYYIYDDRGNLVFARTHAANNITYNDTIKLDSGCYSMVVTDKDCDGLSFFANSDGNGRIWVHPNDAGSFFPPLHRFESEFGCEARLNFTVGWEMGDLETSGYPLGSKEVVYDYDLVAYPNPSNGAITLSIEGNKEMGGALSIYNKMGQKVQQHHIVGTNGIVIDDLPSGQYFGQYQTANDVKTVSFIIVR